MPGAMGPGLMADPSMMWPAQFYAMASMFGMGGMPGMGVPGGIPGMGMPGGMPGMGFDPMGMMQAMPTDPSALGK